MTILKKYPIQVWNGKSTTSKSGLLFQLKNQLLQFHEKLSYVRKIVKNTQQNVWRMNGKILIGEFNTED